ncbi:M23 family metallopeptidase [Bacillus aquiflavi]|uniref:M23 family metallopeptidase n=1 Tax=Bacillus aquiflavi TaxID=2672567 RepID=A0A6B3W0G9_9BACI|nr:M23 family metallopeptidase [Bacillus aquiflavi]MBA4537195.1 M23 family metallopeptidase [Bacillus aquiflavi]NEY81453.1 M23 family metallopeptidase [Bacillus aquiflavi]UAC47414.1 M23 family metallopeptidase [Bacillus aquiflavi]
MGSRADEIRKRMLKRKREREREAAAWKSKALLPEDEERYGFEKLPIYDHEGIKDHHPLFNKNLFLFKLLLSACLFLIVAILFRNEATPLEPIRSFVKKSMDQDFQFAAVADWYEGQFGKPLALFPLFDDKETKKKNNSKQSNYSQYALPASGRIVENFETNGQGIMIETGKGAPVDAMNEGIVRFAGMKDELEKTVIIQHADQSETWYGHLSSIDVNLFEFVEKGGKVGTVSNNVDDTKGAFYFAIKKGEDFIDPIRVINFE